MICEKALSITINSMPFAWWEFEEAAGDRIDSLLLIPLTDVSVLGGGTITRVAGKINFAAELSATDIADYDLGGNFVDGVPGNIAANGFTVAGWMRRSGDALDTILSLRTDDMTSGPWSVGISTIDTDVWRLFSGSPSNTTVIAAPTGAWQFFVFGYDPGTNLVTFEWDRNGTVYSVVNAAAAQTNSLISLFFGVQGRPGPPTTATLAVDETGVFPFVLTEAQKDYLWNGGAGRTLPINLP